MSIAAEPAYSVGLIEAGEFNPIDQAVQHRICRALGVTLNDLFWEEAEHEKEEEQPG